jgi:hypothetical protein
VHQCSFIVAPGWYTNTNSDEDDWQGWGIRKDKWDLAPVGVGKKRIRLAFSAHQYGQNTSFSGIVYQVTATGILEPPMKNESSEIKACTSNGNIVSALIIAKPCLVLLAEGV